ncbi:hypothetical protein TNCV_4615221 [Trichonephila clavipes]|nr:hypothetical protein TNCV_4615221 [Trichonephila clavipes]
MWRRVIDAANSVESQSTYISVSGSLEGRVPVQVSSSSLDREAASIVMSRDVLRHMPTDPRASSRSRFSRRRIMI